MVSIGTFLSNPGCLLYSGIYYSVRTTYILTSSSCAASLCVPTSSWLAHHTPLHLIMIRQIMVGVDTLNVIREIYSTVWKGTTENQECTNGDYYFWLGPYTGVIYYKKYDWSVWCSAIRLIWCVLRVGISDNLDKMTIWWRQIVSFWRDSLASSNLKMTIYDRFMMMTTTPTSFWILNDDDDDDARWCQIDARLTLTT